MARKSWTTMELMVALTAVVALVLPAVTASADDEAEHRAQLPEAAAAALTAAFPGARVSEVEQEDENGLTVYEAEVKLHGEERDVEVTADGVILEIEVEVDMKDVPAAAATAIRTAAADAKVKELAREEIQADIVNGAVVPLEETRIVYSAELKQGDRRGEIGVLADGTVVEPLEWRTKGQHEAKEHAPANAEKR